MNKFCTVWQQSNELPRQRIGHAERGGRRRRRRQQKLAPTLQQVHRKCPQGDDRGEWPRGRHHRPPHSHQVRCPVPSVI